MASEKADVVLQRYGKTAMSYCYVKRTGYVILFQEAIFKKYVFRYSFIYLCLNMTMSGKTYVKTLIVDICGW